MIEEFLVRRFVSKPENVLEARVREQYGVLQGWVSIVINVVITLVKLIPGIIIGSVSLIADAAHSLSDVAGSIVVIWGFKAAAKPSDKEHPYGHGRVENIATLIIAIILFVVAWEFGQNSVIRLMEPKEVKASPLLLVLLVVSIVLKEWLSRFALNLSKKIDSSTLKADSWHHRSDVLATSVVIAALIASNLGVLWVDGVGGLIVAGFIAWAAWELLQEAMNPLIGEAPSPGVLKEIRDTALAVPEVDEVHDLMVHRYGELSVISLHIEISSEIDLTRAHDIAEAVESRLNERFRGWSVVHVDPVNRHHPLYAEVTAFLEQTVPAIPGAGSYHDLRIVGTGNPCYVILDLKIDGGDHAVVAEQLRAAIAARFPSVAKVHVNVEPGYVY